MHIMLLRRRLLRVSAWLLAAAVLVPVSFAQGKRPLNHGDYDGWRSIVGQRLSNDGKFLVYGLFPQEGDGEVVVRNLVTGKEQREPAGVRPLAGRFRPSAPSVSITSAPPKRALSVCCVGFCELCSDTRAPSMASSVSGT